jgi:hypothetical protein
VAALDREPGAVQLRGQVGSSVAAEVADLAVERAHRHLERRHDQHHPPPRPHESRERAQRRDVVLDVLEHVAGDHGRVLAGLGDRRLEFTDADALVVAEAVAQAGQSLGVRLARGDLHAEVRPRGGVVPDARTDLQRILPEVGAGELGEPVSVVHRTGERLERLRLTFAVTSDAASSPLSAAHVRSWPVTR